jgi:ribokinase
MPEPGETVFGQTLEQHPGGKGLNQAVACARLGAQVSMVGAVGSGADGTWLRSVVTDEGIDDAGIATLDGPSGTALIEVDASGANRIVVISAANDLVTAEQVDSALAALDASSVVLLQGEIPMDAIEAALRAARAAGARTVLNPAPVRDYPDAIYALADVVIPNEHEAALISGLPTDDAAFATAAARAIVARGAGACVVTRGGEGSVWATADATGSCAAFSIVPVDTVAAGDAFCGGVSTALAEGRDLAEALRWGSAAGALAATRPGAVPSLPRRAEAEELLRRA